MGRRTQRVHSLAGLPLRAPPTSPRQAHVGELTDDDMLDIMAAQWDWAFEKAGIPEVLRAQESSTRAPRGPRACPERARNG